MYDLISRQKAIEAVKRLSLGETDATRLAMRIGDYLERLPTAQSERLSDDDFETIKIHLNAQKERLCNQQRWKEAEEYQRIIDRFVAFASTQPDVPDTNVGDTISRREAIDACTKAKVGAFPHDAGVNNSIKALKALSSAQPQRMRGKWMEFGYPWFKCSQCGAVREQCTFLEYYCPNCGAKMEGTE